MVDPKMVEMSQFNGIPHLLMPVVVDLDKVPGVLQWASREMDRRYRLFSRVGARNLDAYNAYNSQRGERPLPYIVTLVDELADLMMVAPDEIERSVCRIAQMARATGIHLVLATQRPSVDVVTGLIKANFPARISFGVTSQVDSRVVLDTPGAEKLLGRGDMLYMASDSSRLVRLQGCFVSDEELGRLVKYWTEAKAQAGAEVAAEAVQQTLWPEAAAASGEASDDSKLLAEAEALAREQGRVTISLLQRRLRVGFTRAARLMEELEARGTPPGDDAGPPSSESTAEIHEKDTPPTA
jgi:S-DNA-T family DNA segregation ATPase FtsK/SpoIIIE